MRGVSRFGLPTPGYKVERFKFSNGVASDEAAIKARVITVETLNGYNDGLTGGTSANFIDGGYDTVCGGAGITMFL